MNSNNNHHLLFRTLFHLFVGNNKTVIQITLNTSFQKLYIEYFCGINNSKDTLCYKEIDTKGLFFTKLNQSNFLAFKIYANTLTFFINAPKSDSEIPKLDPIELNFNLGLLIENNKQFLNFYVSKNLLGNL